METGKETENGELLESLLDAMRLAVRYLDEHDGTRIRPNPVRELLALKIAEAEAKLRR